MAAGVAGAVMMFRPHRQHLPRWAPGALFAAGIIGLTLNGAIHDLSLGTPTRWFPLVSIIAMAGGVGFAMSGMHLLRRLFPPVTGVTWNEPGLEGSVAQVVTSTAASASSGGRARVRGADGVVHVVRIYAPGQSLRFGRKVKLGPFDDSRSAYPVEPV